MSRLIPLYLQLLETDTQLEHLDAKAESILFKADIQYKWDNINTNPKFYLTKRILKDKLNLIPLPNDNLEKYLNT